MTQEEFLEELQAIMRSESALAMDSELDDIDGWDSLAMLSLIVFAETKFGMQLNVNDFKQFQSPKDIFNRIIPHGN